MARRSAAAAGLGGMLGGLVDMNGDGNPLDDIMRMVGKVLG
jgi:hypothetical protein